ncbi:MAG: DedA family protein [Spirochaetia bacterium]|nr:DedA family protein [Spirochaetia bacterium]
MDISEILSKIPESIYWLFVFISSVIENIFPPYPGDSVTVFGGYLAGTGRISLYSLVFSVYSGSLAGAIFMYYMGEKVMRYFRKKTKLHSLQELLNPKNLLKTHHWFKRYGISAVIVSRFSAGIRFFVAIVAGMAKMNIWLFILSFSIATFIWNFLLIFGGYKLGENWSLVMKYLKIYNSVVGAILVIFVIVIIIILKKKKNKQKKEKANIN